LSAPDWRRGIRTCSRCEGAGRGAATRHRSGWSRITATRWLVAPYGERNWVKNARASGVVELRRGCRHEQLVVTELGPEESAPILKRYLNEVPITRPFFTAAPADDLAAFRAEAALHPVFALTSNGGNGRS
jgi:hypothetical protein